MPIGDICKREVTVTKAGSSIEDAARLMREHHVGCLVVIEEVQGKRKPVGMLTDRDIALKVVADAYDPAQTPVGEIMSAMPVSVDEECGIFEAIRVMRDQGVRRVPVLNKRNSLLGIIAMDDLTALLAEELRDLSRLITREQRMETVAHA